LSGNWPALAKPKRLAYFSFMPTVLRLGGLKVRIYPNDHRPAHVHVIGGDWEMVFHLHCPEGPPELLENYRGPRREVGRTIGGLTEHLTELCEQWERIHGPV
jgi:Domain of unknown function (DUF4160)